MTAFRRLGSVVLACALACAGATAEERPAAAALEGKWAGTAGFPTDRVEIGFEFKRNDKGELKAFIYHPVMNFYGLELPGTLRPDGENKWVLTAYSLRLTRSGDNKLEGTYFGLRAPITLERTDKLAQEVPIPDLPTGPGPKWQTKLGAPIFAPAAVRDNIAYVGTTGGMFYAVDLKDGSFVWPFIAGRPVYGEATVTDGHVYFVCDNGLLFKLDRATGQEVWRYDLGDAQVPRTLPHLVSPKSGGFDWDCTAPCPVMADGVLYVGAGDGGLHAVSAETGQRIWRFAAAGKLRTTAAVDAKRVYVGSFGNHIYAVDRQTGQEVWKRDTRAQVTSAPVLVDGKLIVGNRGGVLGALSLDTGEPVWRMLLWGSAVESEPVPGAGTEFFIGSSDLRRASRIDAKDGRVLWRTDVYGWAWPRPALTEKVVYAAALGTSPYLIRHVGGLCALDRDTGKPRWRWPTPAAPGAMLTGFAAAPVVAGGTVVIGSVDGTLYGFGV